MNSSVVMEEGLRAIILGGLVAYLFWESATHRDNANARGWRMILAGFVLLLFASVLDLSDNFPSLNWLIILGDTPEEAFFEKIPGYLGGFVLVAWGLVRWMPHVRQLQQEICARREAEQRLQKQYDYLQSVVDGVPEPLMVIDLNYQVRLMNRRCASAVTHEDQPPGPLTCHWLSHKSERPCETKDHRCPLREVLHTGRPMSVIHLHTDSDGKPYPVEVVAAPHFDDNGKLTGIIETTRDISERITFKSKLLERDRQVRKLTYNDTLTGLPNHLFLTNRLEEILNVSKNVILLAIDIDHFKKVNQGLGYDAGDELLRATSARLKTVLRTEDVLARVGGDNFLIVTTRLIQAKQIELFIEELQSLFSKAFTVADQMLYLRVSIGLALYPNDGDNAETLINHAVAANQAAFETDGSHVQYFSANMSKHAREQILLETHLRDAIKQEQLVLYYQPQINIDSGRIVGAEALVRWQHPQLGLVAPSFFIPLAERTGLITALGEWVLRNACAQARKWHELEQFNGRIGVNISGRQFDEADITDRITSIMRETDCPAAALELEITESLLLRDPEWIAQTLLSLRNLGLSIAMDDFGTGYSSLSQLRHLPINKLKIDQSFVRDLPVSEDAAAVTRAIITLATSMNLQIIAEGVETIEQSDFLQLNGCQECQGYLYGRPMDSEKFSALLANDQMARVGEKDKYAAIDITRMGQ